LGLIDDVASDYRLSGHLTARLLGFFLAGLGVAVFALTVIVGVTGLPVVVVTGGVVLAVVAILLVGFLFTLRSAVVRLDEEGYQVRLVRGAGVKAARWREVEGVVATTVASERCVVLRLKGGRTTTVPVRVLAGDPDAFVRDLQSHLDRHGRLDQGDG